MAPLGLQEAGWFFQIVEVTFPPPASHQHLAPSDFSDVHQLCGRRNLPLLSLGIPQNSAELLGVSALSWANWPQFSSPDNCLLKYEGDLSFSFIIDLQSSLYSLETFYFKALGAAVSSGLSVSFCDGFCCTDLNCNEVKFLTCLLMLLIACWEYFEAS